MAVMQGLSCSNIAGRMMCAPFLSAGVSLAERVGKKMSVGLLDT